MGFLKTEPGADPIVVEGSLEASPAEVFRAWTDPNVVKRWFGRAPNTLVSATIDLRVGGAWRFLEHEDGVESIGFEGEYLAIELDHCLVFTWVKFTTTADGGRTSTPPSQVEISLFPSETGTNLRVTHSAIHGDEMRRGFAHGWNHGIAAMQTLFASGRT